MRPDQRSGLPREVCVSIVRLCWPAGTDEDFLLREADAVARFVAEFPPPTQEQLDKVRALLRPESWGPTVHTGERRPG